MTDQKWSLEGDAMCIQIEEINICSDGLEFHSFAFGQEIFKFYH